MPIGIAGGYPWGNLTVASMETWMIRLACRLLQMFTLRQVVSDSTAQT